jgi:hypothetical protein
MKKGGECCVGQISKHAFIVAAEYGQLEAVKRFTSQILCKLTQNTLSKAFAISNHNGHFNVADYLVEECHVHDEDMEILKKDLTRLVDIIFLKVWETKGWRLFCPKVPAGIEKLRELLEQHEVFSSSDINTLSRAAIRELKEKFIEAEWFNKDVFFRNPETDLLYELVRNVGRNRPAIYEKLFKMDPELTVNSGRLLIQ